ncbi:ABC transporter permease [Blautia schinkii]|nr:ABC transporter permease [Blautia schinkii]
MLFKLSVKNMKKSMRDYAVYFFTLILGVAIFYIFNSLGEQAVMLEVTKSQREIIDVMADIIDALSLFVSIVLGFLIVYASSFLMKRRKKEFGTYMLLGMGKGKISRLLLCETIVIGLVSLVAGLVAGVLLSQAMSILVANMFAANMNKFAFVISARAIEKTILYFGIMYISVMILNTFLVGRFQLIDLLRAGQKNERMKVKNSVVCVIVFLISAVMLGYAYYRVSVHPETVMSSKSIGFIMLLGALGTLLLFWSVSGFFLKFAKSSKRHYYKGLNSFTVRELNSKVNTNVVTLTVICLMLFVAIIIFSSGISINEGSRRNVMENTPVDINVKKNAVKAGELDPYTQEPYTKEQEENWKDTIAVSLDQAGFPVERYLTDVVEIDVYADENLHMEESLGVAAEIMHQEKDNFFFSSAEKIVAVSDFNRLAKLYDMEPVELEGGQYVLAANFEDVVKYRDMALEDGTEITVNGRVLKPKYNKCRTDYFLDMDNGKMNYGFFIVPDEAIEGLEVASKRLAADYLADNDEERQKIEDIVSEIMGSPAAEQIVMQVNTKQNIIDSSLGSGAVIIFVGLYLGMVFLLAGAAVLALKQLADISDNQDRYRILRNIGVDEKMINRALFVQIGLFFLMPMVLALFHCIFGVQYAAYNISFYINKNMLGSIFMTAGLLAVVYGGYFGITYLSCRNILKE